jgi:hypothetical protein
MWAVQTPQEIRLDVLRAALDRADDSPTDDLALVEAAIRAGVVEGAITHQPIGSNGFGYDPLFQDPQLGVTAAELPLSEKSRLSHRGKALNELIKRLKGD